MAATERVPLSEVHDLIVIGEALPFPVFEASGRLLLNQGHQVASERQFEMLVERGAWCERPRVEAERQARGGVAAPTAARRAHTLFDLWDGWASDHHELLRRASRPGPDKPGAVHFVAMADALNELVQRDADVALYICIRQDGIKPTLYPAWHAMHSAVVAGLTAGLLGWPEAQRQTLLRAALTMNIGVFELQATLAEQRDPMSQKQDQAMRAHPHSSAQLLREIGVEDSEWLQIVEHHHERADGKGYPQGIQVAHEPTQLLRIADVFMAAISGRHTRPALAPMLAARLLVQQQGRTPMAMGLLRALGVHPPGSVVQLASGEVAVVSRRAKVGNAPLVATLSNKSGIPEVSTRQRDTAQAEFAITGPAPESKAFARILPERVYGMVLA
jgi:HD domain